MPASYARTPPQGSLTRGAAKILKGRRATSVAAIRDDMETAGTDWVDEATVVDGNLISARTPADLGPWMKALLRALG